MAQRRTERGKNPLRIAFLISGSGTTLENVCASIERGELDALVVVAVSSRKNALGLERALRRGIPTEVVTWKEHAGNAGAFGNAITARLTPHDPDLVCMGGFLRPWQIPARFAGRVMNIHPALLPEFGGEGFYGERVHRAVLDSGAKVSGCTVHFADNSYDHGPIILQRTVPVLPGDTPHSLAERVFAEECRAYPEAIRLFQKGRLKIEAGRVRILPPR